MRQVLITGGCGFIGTNFVRMALKKRPSWQILVLDNLTYAGSLDNLKEAGPFVFKQIDLRDNSSLNKAFNEWKPELIFHFAAETHVDRSITDPRAFFKTNVEGTLNLLEEAKKNNIELFHHISTDEVYGSLSPNMVASEDATYKPGNPYSASKAASDHMVRAWHKTYGLPVKITTCSNNYGPYQIPEKLIPLLIVRASNMIPLPIYGNGEHVRDWIHVNDHCNAILVAAEKGLLGESYNVGSSKSVSNIKLAETICDLIDLELGDKNRRSLITRIQDRPGHDLRYSLNTTKLQNLGWQPEYNLDEGLVQTIKWYLANPQWVISAQKRLEQWLKNHYVI